MEFKSKEAELADDVAAAGSVKAIAQIGSDEHIDAEARRRLVRKLDLRLIPILCITYALQSIDRTTLSYAAVFGVREDLNLTSTEFSWAGALLYIGYLFWEFPTNVMLQKLPINRFMAATVIIWGAVLMCHAAAVNFSGLAAVRTFLGAFEASINPGTMLLFSMYYERKEQPLRMGMWVGSAGIGYICSGIVSFGIGHIQGSLASWRILFLFWGAITVAWGVVVMLWLPGSPLTAKFLSEEERVMVINRANTQGTGIENKHFKWTQFREAMTDLKTWLLFTFAVASNTPNGGLTVVSICPLSNGVMPSRHLVPFLNCWLTFPSSKVSLFRAWGSPSFRQHLSRCPLAVFSSSLAYALGRSLSQHDSIIHEPASTQVLSD